jgi:hypothetical protein
MQAIVLIRDGTMAVLITPTCLLLASIPELYPVEFDGRNLGLYQTWRRVRL